MKNPQLVKILWIFSYNIGRNIFNISVRIFHLGGRHTVCQGSFNSHLGD